MLFNIFGREKKQGKKDITKITPADALWKYLQGTNEINNFFDLPDNYSVKIHQMAEGLLIFEVLNAKDKAVYHCNLQFENYNGKNKLYLYELYRKEGVEYISHTGSRILNGIAKIAEQFEFKFVAINPQASTITDNALSQNELEEWYKRHLSEKKFVYKVINTDYDLYNMGDD